MWYQGFTVPILGVAAPWIATRFGLSQGGVAKLYASASISALVTFGLARLVDRLGRRRMLLACLTAASLFAIAEATADSTATFAFWELLRFSAVNGLGSSAVALLVESLPNDARAAGVGRAGTAAAIGGACCLMLMPAVANTAYGYRWLLLTAAGGLVFVPALIRLVPESTRWETARATGAVEATSVFDIFGRRWRRRAVAILAATLLGGVEGAAVGSWSYYYGVSVVGVSAGAMSIWSLGATALGLLGFYLGAASAEKYGRVRTVVVFGLINQAAALLLYLGPHRGSLRPALWVGAGLCLGGLTASARGTAGTTAGLELFPTRLRATMLGWTVLFGAIATGCAHLLVASLVGPLGISYAIALLSVTGIAGIVLFGLYVDETRGLSLEAAAGEAEIPRPPDEPHPLEFGR